MTLPAWPTTLPAPLDATNNYAPLADNVIRTTMETSAPKTRRRFTAMPDTFDFTLILTSDQTNELTAFAVGTLQDVLPFTWVDWRDGSAATYTFQKRPTFARASGSYSPGQPQGMWVATVSLLKAPT